MAKRKALITDDLLGVAFIIVIAPLYYVHRLWKFINGD